MRNFIDNLCRVSVQESSFKRSISNIESSKEKGSWKHVKMIKFCERPLTSMDVFRCENKDSVIAVSDATGHIRFLSPDMKILFWLKRPILSGLSAISFTEHERESIGFDAEAEESTIDKVAV